MSGHELVIREMERRDLDVVVPLEARLNPRPWSRALLIEELRLPARDRCWLVGTLGSDVVAYGGTMFAGDEAHLMLLGVDPGLTRRGIGRAICRALIDDAARRGSEGFTLEVRASNTAAIALYESLEMTRSGVRPGYYTDGEAAVVYWLHDLGSGIGRAS